jgi:hypothetical protein
MLGLNFQDLFGSIIAVLLFPIVSMIPGYFLGWAFDLFNFRKRSRLAKYIISIVLSNALMPVFSYLVSRFLSINFWVIFLIGATGIALVVHVALLMIPQQRPSLSSLMSIFSKRKFALLLGAIWVVFSLFLLVDIQIGTKLYFANVSYDYTTRISIINAISRTGIPPINPSYFPGHPEKLTYLYYYWYILPSIINLIAGNFINGRQVMIGGTIWTGICLISVIGLYLRGRNKNAKNSWIAPLIGIQLLAVSGLDFIPVVTIDLRARQLLGHMIFQGQIEGWNMPIISWLNAITWVPNHVSALTQCLTAMFAILTIDESDNQQLIVSGTLSGICFASAFGTSTWVTLVFAIAWLIWAVILLFTKRQWKLFCIMAGAGLLGIGLSIPFISGLFGQSGNPTTILPVAFYVRPFSLVEILVPEKLRLWANLLFLPMNYLMELGLFFILGLYRLQHNKGFEKSCQPFMVAETILLAVVAIMLSFLYSTAEGLNDLGIRGWLLGQFVLLVWATDVIQKWLENKAPTPKNIFSVIGKRARIGKALQFVLIIGILTTTLEAFYTRMWPILVDWNVAGFPNNLSPDTNFGSRTYDAKLVYEYINTHLPIDAVIQYNPNIYLDRPSGLYGERQVAISDIAAYGIPESTLKTMQNDVATIFEHNTTWEEIDKKCTQYSIDALVINDLDPLWKHLPDMEKQRGPIYQNQYYAVFDCGTSSAP